MDNTIVPKVSIIVPVFNVEKYLRECLESLINQTLKEIEIICVNDGSTDFSPQIIDEYAEKDSRVIAIHKTNSGYGASMNCGLARATGKYIGIVESDDFAELDMFEKLLLVAEKNEVDVVKSNYYAYWSKDGIKNEFIEVLKNVEYNKIIQPINQREIFYVRPCIWAAIYSRVFLVSNQINFTETPGASYQDTAFNFKVWTCAEKAYFLEEAYLHYRRDNENSSVKSTAKIFCVCDEYASIESFLDEHPEKKKQLVNLKNRLKYETYRWNLERLDYNLKLTFLQRMSQEFKEARDNNELERDLYNFPQWKMIEEIIISPDQFFQNNYKNLSEAVVTSNNYMTDKKDELEKAFKKIVKKIIFKDR